METLPPSCASEDAFPRSEALFSAVSNRPRVFNEDMRDHKQIEFYSGDNTYVRLFFVDVANIEESLEELKNTIEGGYAHVN